MSIRINHRWSVLIILSVFSLACGNDEARVDQAEGLGTDGAASPTHRYAYVWVDGLSLLEEPEVGSANLGSVAQASRVSILSEQTGQGAVILDGRFISTRWQQVQIDDGTAGWVPEAGLRTLQIRERDDAPTLSLDLSSSGENIVVGGFGSQRRNVEAGGTTQMVRIAGSGCNGYGMSEPTMTFRYVQPSRSLRIFVDSSDDTVLAVRLPNGRFQCADDSVGRNPVITLSSPSAGTYQVWAGSYNSGRVSAELVVTESQDLRPVR